MERLESWVCLACSLEVLGKKTKQKTALGTSWYKGFEQFCMVFVCVSLSYCYEIADGQSHVHSLSKKAAED